MSRQHFASVTALMVVALLGPAGCGKSQAPAQTAAIAPPASSEETPQTDELGQPNDPRFIGKIWVSTTSGHPRGSMLIFLPDRSLLMVSCFETYRISKWGVEGDQIRWIEDAIPIQATISMPSDNELNLQLTGQDRVQSYVTATVPYACPDMPK
jgi:hypothetical protein